MSTISTKFEAGQKVRYTGESFLGLVKGEIYTIHAVYTGPSQAEKIEVSEVPHVIRSYACFEEIKHTYSVGQFFTRKDSDSGSVYVLAQTAPHKVSLIDLLEGNRYEEGVTVSCMSRITKEEFSKISYGKEFVEVGLDWSIIGIPSKIT